MPRTRRHRGSGPGGRRRAVRDPAARPGPAAHRLNPPASTFVNIPTIFHATIQGPRSIALTVDDVTLALQVAPRWHWDFGDGAALDADSPGVGYDDTSPTADPDHYPVLHTYTDHGQVHRRAHRHLGRPVHHHRRRRYAFPAPVKTYNDARALPIRQATATITGNG